jgi:hypothetical protein
MGLVIVLGKSSHLLEWGNAFASRDTALESPPAAESVHQIHEESVAAATPAVSTSASPATTTTTAASLIEPTALIEAALIVATPNEGGRPTQEPGIARACMGCTLKGGGMGRGALNNIATICCDSMVWLAVSWLITVVTLLGTWDASNVPPSVLPVITAATVCLIVLIVVLLSLSSNPSANIAYIFWARA